MKRYNVKTYWHRMISVNVEADSEEEALLLAYDAINEINFKDISVIYSEPIEDAAPDVTELAEESDVDDVSKIQDASGSKAYNFRTNTKE